MKKLSFATSLYTALILAASSTLFVGNARAQANDSAEGPSQAELLEMDPPVVADPIGNALISGAVGGAISGAAGGVVAGVAGAAQSFVNGVISGTAIEEIKEHFHK